MIFLEFRKIVLFNSCRA